MHNNVEILAPAGSVMSLQASFKAGADAVYMGGTRFGARAYAENPNDDELIRAIDYAHLHGKRLYLTVNTLVKESEFGGLYDYLNLLMREGLDAVLIQDLGVLDFVMKNFKSLPIHISTQGNITESLAVRFYNEQITRIVPARELTLEEIRELKKKTGREIEVFVHGALCYSYSGQCLFSSMCGDRSGNRGRCAQPCRKPYDVEINGKTVLKNGYILSPKDICTLDRLPDLIEAGVDSFKIEGRMKSPAYAAGVSEIYSKAVELYEKLGRGGYYDYIKAHGQEWHGMKVSLADLFNRGGFSEGYAFSETGPLQMSIKRPNHEGVKVGEAVIKNGIANCSLSEEVYKGDVLELRSEKLKNPYSYTCPEAVRSGARLNFRAVAKDKEKYIQGLKSDVYRYRCDHLFEEIEEIYIKTEDQVEIDGFFEASIGEPLRLTLKTEANPLTGKSYEAVACGQIVQEAQSAPISADSIKEKLLRTTGAAFCFKKLEVKMSPNAFIPKSMLGKVRRDAFELLEDEIKSDFKRRALENYEGETTNLGLLKAEIESDTIILLKLMVHSKEQLDAAVKSNQVKAIILDMNSSEFFEISEAVLKQLKAAGIEAFIRTPRIADSKNVESLKQTALKYAGLTAGYYVSNLSHAAVLSELKQKIYADKFLYTFNSQAVKLLEDNNFSGFIYPSELTLNELLEVKKGYELLVAQTSEAKISLASELCIYGREELMVSRQCIKKTLNSCNGRSEWLTITSEGKEKYPVYTSCKQCRNYIYNSRPLDLSDYSDEISRLALSSVIVQLTDENYDLTLQCIHKAYQLLNENSESKSNKNKYTGHFHSTVK
jgi:putative protease